ncbi:ABC transporter permease [Desulfotomaculum copahuensis]|nr:ABC transporter permease [Desulfotomaculum copahuensis]
MLFFALRNVWRKKGISLLAILGVGLGCALMTFLFAISAGLNARLEKTFSGLAGRVVVSPRDAIFGGMFFSSGTPLPAGYLDAIRQMPGVLHAYGRVAASLRPADDPNLILPFNGYTGEETARPGSPFKKIIAGRAPVKNNEIIIGKRLQDSLGFINGKMTAGHSYRFIVPDGPRLEQLTLTVTGVFETGNEISDTSFCGPADLARKIARFPPDKYSSIDVQVDSPERIPAVEKEITAHFRQGNPPVQVVIPRDLLNPLRETLDTVNKFLTAVSLVAALAGGLSIAIIMSASVLERMREFAVLKAVGWRGRHIVMLVLMESLILSLCGAALGLGLGGAGAVLVRRYVFPDMIVLNRSLMAAVAAAGIITGTFGGLYPAWRAKQAAPADIFRQG